ncbi:hypothetical protein FDECE_1271, partial [Fusarium decemcellulare]
HLTSVQLNCDEEQFLGVSLEELYDTAAVLEDNPTNSFGQWKLLGSIYYLIFQMTEDQADLGKAIRKTEQALETPVIEPSENENTLKNLIVMLTQESKDPSSQSGENLEKASNYGDMLVSMTKRFDVNRGPIISDVLRIKSKRALELRSLAAFDEALFAATAAMGQTEEDEQYETFQQAIHHYDVFEETNNLDELDMAVSKAKQAIAATVPDDPHKAKMLSNLALYTSSRYKMKSKVDDLNMAIRYGEEAVATVGLDDETRGVLLGNLAACFADRFHLLGHLEDLHLCIAGGQNSVSSLPRDSPVLPSQLSNLSSGFQVRYDQTGDPEDIQKAIERAKECLDLTAPGTPTRRVFLNTLAKAYHRRFWVERQLGDLETAICLTEEAVAESTADDFIKSFLLSDLSAAYAVKFKETGDPTNLDLGIKRAELGLTMALPNQINTTKLLANLASLFSLRFILKRDPSDQKLAIERSEAAVAATAPTQPNLAILKGNLGVLLRAVGDDTSRQRALSLFLEASEHISSPPKDRIRFACDAANILAKKGDWVEASRVFEMAVNLLPLIAPRQLHQERQQSILEEFEGLATHAASAALEAKRPTSDAVRLLELGRGIITGLRFGIRTDLNKLRKTHPELADKFEQLRDELDSPTPTGPDFAVTAGTLAPRTSDRHDVSAQLDAVIGRIRLLDGFEDFLQPPTVDELRVAASSGPIVFINVSEFRRDALIIQPDGIRSLPLHRLHESDIKQKAEDIQSIRSATGSRKLMTGVLEWLWDVVVGPILDHLGYLECPKGEWPRIWWIPTGWLSLLPLHAAGYHSPPFNKSALDRVISSYSSSVKALRYARETSQTLPGPVIDKSAVLVSMATTPRQPPLSFSEEEVSKLDSILPRSMQKLKLDRPDTQDVLKGLANCSIFHFAGHGESHLTNPSKSLLLTTDWETNPLTVEAIFGLKLRENSPCLAYLSACSTSENHAANLHDEAIHLVTACQLAGFQHVVGSMWEVSDRYSVDAAEQIYQVITNGGEAIDGDKISLAVHLAVRRLREITGHHQGGAGPEAPRHRETSVTDEENVQIVDGEHTRQVRPSGYKREDWNAGTNPLIWAAYIHVGP